MGYALHNNRVRYSCYTSLWASVGQDEPRGSGVARARTTKPFPRGTKRKTVMLDRDISDRVGMCVIESLRLDYRFDVAIGMFVPAPQLVRRDAPGPPDLSVRPGETRLETAYVGRPSTPLFLGERSVRIVLTDEAPISVQRDFRAQALNVSCSDRSGFGPGRGSVTVRFPPRSREVVANFPKPIIAAEGVTCGAEAGGSEAFGAAGEPGLLGGGGR